MVHVIDCRAVQDLLETRQAQPVEVLPRKEYRWAHLPGADHLPLKELNETTAGRLDRNRPIIVYCHDWLCDMSPRAAHRLERLGFDDVFDYRAGKMDWISADLPYEGDAALVAQALRRDPVIARPDDPLDRLADRIVADPAGLAIVADEDNIVQGVVGPGELTGAPPAATAGEAMRFGVTTVRPSEEVTALVRRMDRAKVQHIVVTKPDGTLVGLFGLGDLRPPHSEPDLG